MDGDLRGLPAVVLPSPGPYGTPVGSSHPEMDLLTPEKLQELIWFFRTEDSSSWNYSILALSLAVLLLGIVLLALNIMANRNRKDTLLHSEEYKDAQTNGTEMKQGFLTLQEEPAPESLLLKGQTAGEVTVQWKDGNITTLYAGASEEDA
ncbi:organic solute transporter subunit beta isoform X2 [Paroedura picta]